MSQVSLLKEYIKTLQSENQAKNTEREKLYQQLAQLGDENEKLAYQLNQLRSPPPPSDQAQHYILQLQQNIHCMKMDLDNLVQILQERDSQISSITYQREKDTERINDLEILNKDLRKAEARLKEELIELKEQYRIIVAKLDECSENTRVNELIENYEKIQQLAKEKNIENDELRYQKDNLLQEVEYLKKMVQAKENQIKSLKKNKRQESSGTNKQQHTTNISLIRQNNRLIQRVTELEKQKNTLYVEAFANESEIIHPLRINVRPPVNSQGGDEKIKDKIQAIKSANQALLQNLKI